MYYDLTAGRFIYERTEFYRTQIKLKTTDFHILFRRLNKKNKNVKCIFYSNLSELFFCVGAIRMNVSEDSHDCDRATVISRNNFLAK